MSPPPFKFNPTKPTAEWKWSSQTVWSRKTGPLRPFVTYGTAGILHIASLNDLPTLIYIEPIRTTLCTYCFLWISHNACICASQCLCIYTYTFRGTILHCWKQGEMAIWMWQNSCWTKELINQQGITYALYLSYRHRTQYIANFEYKNIHCHVTDFSGSLPQTT